MKTVVVNVTQEHIDKGERGRCQLCPLALALRDAGFPNASVTSRKWATSPYEPLRYFMPEDVREFIRCFDGGLPVRPATFVLEVE